MALVCTVVALMPAVGAVLGFVYGPTINRFLAARLPRVNLPASSATS